MGIFQSKSNTSAAPAPAPAAAPASTAPAPAPASTTAAASSASAASTSAKAASDSASAAATSATAAATSVSAAATSASAASTSATNAASSATAAASSATNAADSASQSSNYIATLIASIMSGALTTGETTTGGTTTGGTTTGGTTTGGTITGITALTTANVNELINLVTGRDRPMTDTSTQTIQQKNNLVRLLASNKSNEFDTFLTTYLANYGSITYEALMTVGSNWILTNTINIPLDRTTTILTKERLFKIELHNSGNTNLLNYVNLITATYTNNYLLLMAILYRYIFNHIEDENVTLFSNLKNIINDLVLGTRSLNDWQTISESFTNYSSNRSINNIDYSKISIDNGSSMWHNKLSGSCFSPKV